MTGNEASDSFFLSAKAIYTWATGLFQTIANKDATGWYAGLTLFKINFRNAANTFTSFLTNSNTAARTYTFQDSDDTIVGRATTDTLTNKTLTSPLFQWSIDWWTLADETWTYASATTFTVTWDVSAKYQKGDRIKLTQSATVKYFVILKVAVSGNTTITITWGTSYTFANSAVTLNYYSKQASPQWYPDFFNYTPTWTWFSADPTVSACKFAITGSICDVMMTCSVNGTSNATGMTITTPNSITSAWVFYGSVWFAVDNSVVLTTVTSCNTTDAGSTIVFRKTPDAAATWTASGAKRANCTIRFQYTL